MPLSRREMLSTVGSLAVWTFCQLAVSRRAAASAVSPMLVTWLRDVDDLARSVGAEAVSQAQWRSQMDALYRRVPFADVLKLVDLDELVRRVPLPPVGESFERQTFPRLEGLPAAPRFFSFVGGLRAGRSIPPHGHNHIVSSFLVLKGELRGRHFDRLCDDGDWISIAQTSDRSYGPGDCSTVSQQRDNVHGFTAQKDHSFILDIGVADLAPSGTTQPFEGQQRGKTGRIYLDIDRGLVGGPGQLAKVRRVSEREAYRLYG